MAYTKILTNTIQIKNAKYWSYLMIWSLILKLKIYLFLLHNQNTRLNSTGVFIMETLQQIGKINHSSDIDFKEFMNLYKTCTTVFLLT